MLSTKLYSPPRRRKAVLRSRLTDRLTEALDRRLTLVSAPAGFGKTSLVCEWIETCGLPVAWLSADEGDSDPTRFLTHLVAALQTVRPALSGSLMAGLQGPLLAAPQSVLTQLVNEMERSADRIVLVIDDYHAIEARAVDEIVQFLIEHAGPRLHLVMTTREDPQLPLARLRASDQMSEVRASDLRFTTEEAAEFLNDSMSLTLTSSDIEVLGARTEGWIAGLQLAALSIRDRDDVQAFITEFAGDNRYITDYLLSEVLDRLPERQREFLLQTSILGRLCGPLCDAVTGHHDGQAMLQTLERGNFFVVPLDERQLWYRYHHLFAGVLAAHLRSERGTRVSDLHLRASDWYESNGPVGSSIDHALQAGDHSRAARLVEQAAPALRQRRQEATLLGWLSALSAPVLAEKPELCVLKAHVLMASGKLYGVAEALAAAERGLAAGRASRAESGADVPLRTQESDASLLASIGIARAGLALAHGDLVGTDEAARKVLEVAPPTDHHALGGAAGFLGLVHWSRGEISVAHQTFTQSVEHLEAAGSVADAVGGRAALGAMSLELGRLRQAQSIYEQGLLLAAEEHSPVRGTADLHVGMAEVAYERDELDTAKLHLQRSGELGEELGFPRHRHLLRVAAAKVSAAEGDMGGALDLLGEAERTYVSDFHPDFRPIPALRARLLVAAGRLDEAHSWLGEQAPEVLGTPSYLHEYAHLTRISIMVATFLETGDLATIRSALDLADRLLLQAEGADRGGNVLSALVLKARCHHLMGERPAALESLTHALKLAEPEGYVRLFLDQGKDIVDLLRSAAAGHKGQSYVRRLLAPATGGATGPLATSHRAAIHPTRFEPLSERELQVLRLLRSDLNGPEIARHLRVSVNTLRTHTKNVYGKLDVTSRRGAVRRADELGLD